jgi:hypothetical protein
MVKVITKNDIAKHPCFDVEARHTHARVHLPLPPDATFSATIATGNTIVSTKADRE